MDCLNARPLRALVCLLFISATALSAAAQGQTPTSPQERPDRRVRPAPSSGIPWDPDGGLDDTGQTPTATQPTAPAQRQRQTQQTGAGTTPTPPAARGAAATSQPRASRAERATSTTGPATAQPDSLVESAAADRGAGRDAAAATRSAATPHTIGGGAGGGGAAFTRGTVGAVSITGQGAYEPILRREPEYGEIPDEGERITLEGPMGLHEFLTTISFATEWNMLVSPALQDVQLRFWIFDVTPRQALEVLKFNKVYYEFDEETQFLRVMSREDYLEREYGKVFPHEFKVNHADVTYVESMVNSLLSAAGRVITDQRTNNIYVWDTEDNIEEMVRIVSEIDVPLKHTEFLIEHADLRDIEAVLATFMSPSGSILSDVRTGQIFVWDAPTVLDQMRMAVTRLDQPVESRTFHIVHVNAEDVVDSIEAMITERGMIQVDPRFNTVVVTDLPPRIAKIAQIIETLDQPLETRTWVIKYADLDFIASEIESFIPGEMGSIIVQDEVHQITVTGLPSRLDEIDTLIKVWDVRRRQVLIEAHIVEVSTEVERAFNVNWSYFTNMAGAPFALHSGAGSEPVAKPTGSGEIMSGGRLPYAVPRYGALETDGAGGFTRPVLRDISGSPVLDRYRGGNIAVTLDYLDQQRKATILSSPRVTVQDSEEAVFENATRVPYVSSTGYGSYGYYPTSGTTTNDPYRRNTGNSRVEFIDVGTILSVLPRVTEDNNILLDISAEDSTFTDKTIVVDDLSRTVPEKTVRRADTQVRVNSGDTIVLGGLRRDRTSHSSKRTPLLSDLPIVGRLFQNPNRTTQNNTLLIFITTTIVDESTMPEAIKIAQADSTIAEDSRQMRKGLLGRLRHHLTEGSSEIGVSIGQDGTIYSAGDIVTVEELQERFFDAPKNMPITAVIRKHPHAPLDIVNEVTEAAMEAGLRIEFDTDIPPIVPSM